MPVSLFADLKVIDCASWIAGRPLPRCCDFGADVIKIEPPGTGDPWRALTPIPGKPTDAYWQLTSRNKRSLALDLKQADGRAVLYRLLASANVFLTNFPLPVRERLQIAPAQVVPLNPRLIYASFTAYGEAGDDAAKTGFDSTAYWARTGLMDIVRARRDRVRALRTRDGQPSQRHRPVCRNRDSAVPAGEDRTDGVVQSSLLQHALRGEVWDKAVIYCQQAGARAFDRAAFREAVTAYEQALRALAYLPADGDTRILAIDLRLALAHTLRGEWRRGRALLGEAAALAQALNDRGRLGRVLAELAQALW